MSFIYPVPYAPPAEVPPPAASSSSSQAVREVPSGLVNGSNQAFTFSSQPVMVFRNGVNETRFGDISGYVFTFDVAPDTDDEIEGCVYG